MDPRPSSGAVVHRVFSMSSIETCAPFEVSFSTNAQRLAAFGKAVDVIRQRVEAELGAEDVAHVRKMNRFSRGMEIVGRTLIQFSFEPLSFLGGVGALWVHKQLQAMEIGHTVLHGVYDKLPGGEKFSSKTFSWDTPIHEESWKHGHNICHHHYTNVAGKDPDINFGPARLTEQTPHHFFHWLQFPFLVAMLAPNLTFFMNLHLTGVNSIYFGNHEGKREIDGKGVTWPEIKQAHRKALKKYIPYYLKNYVFFPALAGPFFWKVLLGNWMAETMRDLYCAATIYCGHVGEDVADYPAGTRAQGKGEWYAMQVEATNNFKVCLPLSILCGGLNLQIEHHLFPRLPPARLREISSEVQAVCEAHGVAYHTDSWWNTLKKALAHMRNLSAGEMVRAAV